MSEFEYDLLVIGAGSGGIRAARMAAQLGAKAVIAEQSVIGGTCVNQGCIPKKLLVYASHFAESFALAKDFGWQLGAAKHSWSSFLQAKNQEIARLNTVYEKLLQESGVQFLQGTATILDAHTAMVDKKKLSARNILIAVGGKPRRPTIPGAEYGILSDDVFHLPALPQRMVIIGGGYIGVEFACILHHLGVEITLLYRGDLFLRGFDEELRELLAATMRRKGIDLRFATDVQSIEHHSNGSSNEYTLHLDNGEQIQTGQVLFAIGREPNTQALRLHQAGIKTNAYGHIVTDSDHRSNLPSVYAIGDVTDTTHLTPVAIREATRVVRCLFAQEPPPIQYDTIPHCVFSQPELASVGMQQTQAQKQGIPIQVYRSQFRPLQYTLSRHTTMDCLLKLVVRESDGQVLGAHMVGESAAEIIQSLAVVIQAGIDKKTWDATVALHPTTAEEFIGMHSD